MVTFWWCHFVVSYLQRCIFYGGGGQRLLCGRVISLVYRVNMLFIADVILYLGGSGERRRPADLRHPCEERCFARWMALRQVTLSHCFYINHVCVCWNCFLDIKHLVVSLFTMAFLRLVFPAAGEKKTNSTPPEKIPLWRLSLNTYPFLLVSPPILFSAPMLKATITFQWTTNQPLRAGADRP